SNLLIFQQHHVETLSTCLDIYWKELGKLSEGYMKRTVAIRLTNQLIPPLLHPVHHTDKINSYVNRKIEEVPYYSELYSPVPIH
ncbi:hypothetical protein BCV72DRAFT_317188, partial [Rhizopus microsporus var. microsporus]